MSDEIEWKIFQANGGSWIAICDKLKLTLQSETRFDLMQDIEVVLGEIRKDLLEAEKGKLL